MELGLNTISSFVYYYQMFLYSGCSLPKLIDMTNKYSYYNGTDNIFDIPKRIKYDFTDYWFEEALFALRGNNILKITP